MSRHHIVIGLALVSATAALMWHNYLLLAAVLLVFMVVVGLGVAIPQMKFFGPYICRGSSSRKQVALTFDDGPDPRSTPRLLELLREANIRAAFFCIGKKVEAHPELAAQIVREGHLLENHTYSHSNYTNFFPSAALRAELERTQAAVKQATGTTPVYFRPPVGLSNPKIFRVAHQLKMQVIGWTIRSLDTVTPDPQKIIARIKSSLQPGAIILLHDGNIPAEKVVATVKPLMDTLRGVGYEIVRLDELLK